MADYFVADGGSNTSPYDTWAKAATSLQTALTAANTNGDRVIIQYNAVPSGDAELSGNATYNLAANIEIIAASNDGGSAFTPTPMGESNWVGNSTAGRTIIISGPYTIRAYGITLRTSAAANVTIRVTSHSTSESAAAIWRDCYFWAGGTGSNAALEFQGGNVTRFPANRLINCTLRFGASNGRILVQGFLDLDGGSITTDGGSGLGFRSVNGTGVVHWRGGDLRGVTDALVDDQGAGYIHATFSQCALASGVLRLRAQSRAGESAADVYLADCFNGDVHYGMEHHNGVGSTVVSASIYANDGASYDGTNRFSWRIDTTAGASFYAPYRSPWLNVWHAGASAITPRLECVRDGSASAYTDAQLWSEWQAKTTNGLSLSSFYSDEAAVAATPASQTTGDLDGSGWTGEGGTAWFGKLTPTASFTPAEIGYIGARVGFAVPSATIYVDPQIRDLS